MKKAALLTFILLLAFSTYAQSRRDRMGNPVISREPTEDEIAKYEQKLEDRKDECSYFIFNTSFFASK